MLPRLLFRIVLTTPLPALSLGDDRPPIIMEGEDQRREVPSEEEEEEKGELVPVEGGITLPASSIETMAGHGRNFPQAVHRCEGETVDMPVWTCLRRHFYTQMSVQREWRPACWKHSAALPRCVLYGLVLCGKCAPACMEPGIYECSYARPQSRAGGLSSASAP